VEAQPSDNSARSAWHLSLAMTALFFILGNLLPSFGLFVTLKGSPVPASWQSGAFHDYASFLLSGKAAALFYPFFLFAIACFTVGLFRPETARFFWLRFGIYSGIVLGVQYCFVVGVVLFQVDQLLTWRGIFTVGVIIPVAALITVGIPWFVWLSLRVLQRYLQRRERHAWWVAILTLTGPCLALLCGLAPSQEDAEGWLFLAIFGPSLVLVIATPVWMVAVYTALAHHARRLHRPRSQFGLLQLLGVFSWLAAYMAAWRFAVVQTLDAYASLPTSPPSGCYVATAAAQGHPWIVHSWPVRCGERQLRRVNLQLAYLKCGELAFRVLTPSWHAYIRRCYDRIGPPAARALRHPLAADLAYFGLKPAEWLVRLALGWLHPEAARLAKRLYR